MHGGMTPALVIFDCDGVLVDSEPLANRVLSEAFHAAGFPISYATCVEHMVGLSLPSCFAMAEEWYGRPLPDDFEATLQARTYAALRESLQPIRGVRSAVAAVAAAGLPRCVASSSEPDKIRLSLELTELAAFFAGNLFSAREVARGKPAPDLFQHAAGRMGAAANDCVVIEDSRYGVQAARAAGMRVLGYVGGEAPMDLAGEGADTFADMAELPALLGIAAPRDRRQGA